MVRWRALKPSQTLKRDCNPEILMVIMPLLFWVRLVISFASSFASSCALAMFQKSLPSRPSILRKSSGANEKTGANVIELKERERERNGKNREKESADLFGEFYNRFSWSSIEDGPWVEMGSSISQVGLKHLIVRFKSFVRKHFQIHSNLN